MPAGVEKMAKTSMLTEKMREVLPRGQPNSSMRATKKTVKERRTPKATRRVRLQMATMTQP
jgi:hypothetical protein